MSLLRLTKIASLILMLGLTISCGSDSSDDTGDPADDGSGGEVLNPTPTPSQQFAGRITDFLWKPKAESAYNKGLLVIHASPCALDVVVNGEHLRDYGPGNGRCVTARSVTTSGCGYGNNAKVEIFDLVSGLPYQFPDGNPYYIIPSGCSRVEFKA